MINITPTNQVLLTIGTVNEPRGNRYGETRKVGILSNNERMPTFHSFTICLVNTRIKTVKQRAGLSAK